MAPAAMTMIAGRFAWPCSGTKPPVDAAEAEMALRDVDLEEPRGFMPGNRMGQLFPAGVPNPSERAALIGHPGRAP